MHYTVDKSHRLSTLVISYFSFPTISHCIYELNTMVGVFVLLIFCAYVLCAFWSRSQLKYTKLSRKFNFCNILFIELLFDVEFRSRKRNKVAHLAFYYYEISETHMFTL